MTAHELDLRGVKCPMNFVKTKLFLDKLPVDDVVAVFLDPGEPVESVTESIQAEGHQIVGSVQDGAGHFLVTIKKCADAHALPEGLC